MSILSESDTDITLRIRAEIGDLTSKVRGAQKDVEFLATVIRAVSKTAKAELSVVANVMKDMEIGTKAAVTQALSLAKSMDKVAEAQKRMIAGGAQRGAIAYVDEQNRWFTARQQQIEAERKGRELSAFNTGKELENAEKILAIEDAKLAKLAERDAIEKKRYDKKVSEIEVDRANAEFERKRREAEAKALVSQERKLGLENAETQAYREQLAELQKMASVDAQRLGSSIDSTRDYAIPGTSDKNLLAIEKIQQAESGLLDTTIPLNAKQKELAQVLNNLEPAAKRAGHGLFTLTNFLRTAFGTLTAIGIFAVMQAIQQFFSNAYQAAQQFRGNMASLNFAEAILSQNGLEITRQELDDTITYIEEKFKYLSTLEVTGIVSTVADMGAEFNLTKEQVTGLSEAVAFLQLKERAYGQEVSDVGSIVNAALDGRSNFFNKLGINITKTAIAEKAYALGLAESGAQLTKEISNQAAIALLIEQTSGKYEELLFAIEQVNPAMANQLRVTKKLEDSSLEIGESVLGVKDAWNEFLVALIEGGTFDEVKESIMVALDALADLVGLLASAYDTSLNLKNEFKEFGGTLGETGSTISSWVGGPGQLLLTLLQLIFLGFTTIIGTIVTAMGILSEFFAYATGAKSYEDAGRAIGQHFANGLLEGISIGLKPIVAGKEDALSNKLREIMELLGKDISTPELPDTPTGTTPPILENQEDLQDALEKMNDEILEAQIKLAQDMEEAAIDLGRKLEDITIEYAKKRADAERDYSSRVRDINADYREKIASIQSQQAEEAQRARNDELEREAKFQEQMRQLKEEFLMNLEDALHERDARQVLRLIDQYNMQKAQAEREHALEQENAQREQEERQAKFARERADAERERKAKLAEAQRDYQDKLAKLKADEEAERAAAELAYQRKIQDLEREMQDRLEIVAANLVAEFNLTKEGLDAILALYQKYYAEISQIYAAMNTMLQGQQNLGSGNAPKTGSGRGSTVGGHKKFAEGGSMLANQPTTVTFGEGRGWELATFTPLESQGNDINKLFTNLSSGGGAEEKIGLEVVLSPDLEARIVKNTLGETAKVITTIHRSKR